MLQPLFRNQATILGVLDPFVSKFATDTSAFVIPAENLGITIEAEKPVRECCKPGIGTLGHNKSMRTAGISFTLPLKQKSSATAESSIGRLLRACGMDCVSIASNISELRCISSSINKTDTLLGSPIDSFVGMYGDSPTTFGLATIEKRTFQSGELTEFDNYRVTGNKDYPLNQLPKVNICTFTTNRPSYTFTITNSELSSALTLKDNSGTYDIWAWEKNVITVSSLPAAGTIINVNLYGYLTSYTVLSADDTIAKLFASLATAITTSICTKVVHSSGEEFLTIYPASFKIADGDYSIVPLWVSGNNYANSLAEFLSTTAIPEISHNVIIPDDTFCYIYYVNNNLNLDRATFTLNYNGIYYSITDCVGTFSIESTAGNTPRITFSFNGLYDEAASSATIPAYSTELLDGNLSVAENGNVTFADYGDEIVIEKFGFDIANEIVKRVNVNSSEGLVNFIRASRSPKITIDPETVPPWVFDPIAKQKSNDLYPYFMRISDNDSYNGEVWFFAPNTQIASAGFGERNKIATTPLELTVTEQGVSTLDSEFYFIFT